MLFVNIFACFVARNRLKIFKFVGERDNLLCNSAVHKCFIVIIDLIFGYLIFFVR